MVRIIRGYSGLIPLKFRELTNTETERLRDFGVFESFKNLKKDTLIEPKALSELLKALVAQNSWELFGEVSNLLGKFPQVIPYYIDIFIKHEDLVDEKTIELLKNYFIEFLYRIYSDIYHTLFFW